MRFGIALLLIATPAYGLDLQDTMQSWRAAPVEVRAQLVRDAAASLKPLDRTRLLSCLNQVADSQLLSPNLVSEMIDYCIKRQG